MLHSLKALLFKAMCLLLGVCIYPIGWDINIIRSVCGNQSDQFRIGTCSIRWPYILACMGVVEIFFLTILGFLLASRQAKYLLKHASENWQNNSLGKI